METICAVGAVIAVVLAIIYVEKVQRGTYVADYGKAGVDSPERDCGAKTPRERRLAGLMSLLMPGTGQFLRGESFRGVRYAASAVFCWFSIGIAVFNQIEVLGLLFAGILVLITLFSTFQAASAT